MLKKKTHREFDSVASLKNKISYGFCGMSYNIPITIIATYLILFSTDIMLINPLTVGALFFAFKFFDAITDIVITNIADKTRTRWGRYRPWMLMGIPLALTLVLVFWFPNFLHTPIQKIL